MTARAPLDDDNIGYGKPPRKHQFKPGESGNPRGRPRRKPEGDSASIALFRSVINSLDRNIGITVNGRKKRITVRDFLVEKLIREALKDPKACANLLKLVERADRAHSEGRAGEPLVIQVYGGLPESEV